MTENRRCTICGFETSEIENGKRHVAIEHSNGLFSMLKCCRCQGNFYDYPHFHDHAQQSDECRVLPYQLDEEPLGRLEVYFESLVGQLMHVTVPIPSPPSLNSEERGQPQQKPEPILIDLTGDDGEEQQLDGHDNGNQNQNGHVIEVIDLEMKNVKEEDNGGMNNHEILIVQSANGNQGMEGGNGGKNDHKKLARLKTTPQYAQLYQYVRESIKKCIVDCHIDCKKCGVSLKATDQHGCLKAASILAHIRNHLGIKLSTCKLCNFKSAYYHEMMVPHMKKTHSVFPTSANCQDSTFDHIDAIKEMFGQCFGENLVAKSVKEEKSTVGKRLEKEKMIFSAPKMALKTTVTTKLAPKVKVGKPKRKQSSKKKEAKKESSSINPSKITRMKCPFCKRIKRNVNKFRGHMKMMHAQWKVDVEKYIM